MTAMLFVGAQTWAQNVAKIGTTEYATLNAAWQAVQDGQTIQLMGNVTFPDDDINGLWLGTACIGDEPKSITLDMNGYSITRTAKSGESAKFFVITHGELKVVNNGSQVSVIGFSGGNTGSAYGTQIFSVYGSYKSSAWAADGITPAAGTNTRTSGYFSHLEIGEGVQIMLPTGCLGTAIALDQIAKGTSSIPYVASGGAIKYFTALDAKLNSKGKYGGYGYAYGARVDFYGEIYSLGGTSGAQKSYGIKANGNLESSLSANGLWSGWATEAAQTQYSDCMSSTDAYLTNYNTKVNAHKGDTIDAPFVYVHKNSKIITSSASTKSAAIYASGYAKWMIEGECEGNVGIYASSGEIALNDASITSTAENYEAPNGGGGVSGSGSAIVVNSRDAYAGGTSVNISGDTEVSATSGYAIEETVTTSDDGSKTVDINITGGTIEGGNQGAIAVTTSVPDPADPSKEVPVTTVYSGNVTGKVVDNTGETPTETTLEALLPTTEETHTTIVYDANGENPVTVVSPGAPIPDDHREFTSVVAALTNTPRRDTIKLTGTTDVISKTLNPGVNFVFAELEMNKVDGENKPVAQTLTIKDNTTVTIGKVVLGKKAKIVVEAGSKLIITGEDGIYSRDTSNLVLKANATDQATFVIAPSVISNRQPYAQVQFVSQCYYTGSRYYWHRFATPIEIKEAPEKSVNVATAAQYINDASDPAVWEDIMAWTDIKPFMAASLTNVSPSPGVVYTFKGRLMGNETSDLTRRASTWNYYGNSFMAPMGVAELLNALKTKNQNIDRTIYYWDMNATQFKPVNEGMFEDFYDVETIDKLTALQFFVLRNKIHTMGELNIDYANTIYNYNVNGGSSAPKRVASNNADRVRINVMAENGASDVVYILGSDKYTADYEDGHDAEKLMNDGLNLYVNGDINYAMLATDDILGTTITLQANEAINYTMSFAKVNGEFALRDNMTGNTVAIVEGATYSFSAQPNATMDGRFQIVGRQEMPTAVETVEEVTNAPKAIYTMMGQYVGETTDWNNLPAGVYVVDGVKVVK